MVTSCWKNTPGRILLIARFMGPTWSPSGADRTQVGPMLAPWTLLSGVQLIFCSIREITLKEESNFCYECWCSAAMLTCCWKKKIFQLMFCSIKEMLLKYWDIFVLGTVSSTHSIQNRMNNILQTFPMCFIKNRMNNILQTFPMCFIKWKCLTLLQYFIEMCFSGPKRLYKAITSTNVNLHLWWHMVSLGCNNK